MNGPIATMSVTSDPGIPANGTEVWWALIGGKIVGADTLTGGTATGTWVQTDPDRIVPETDHVFATVGRARGHAVVGRFDPLPADGMRLRFDHDVLVGDQTGTLVLSGAENTSFEIP